ncbi:MAG: hypothetical protein GY788_06275, partial [bacterium]|nr:hypothetical protein [bacterium]
MELRKQTSLSGVAAQSTRFGIDLSWRTGPAFSTAFFLAIAVGCMPAAAAERAVDRTVLPIAEPPPPDYVELDVRNAT